MYDEHPIISPSNKSTADPPAIAIVAVPKPILETDHDTYALLYVELAEITIELVYVGALTTSTQGPVKIFPDGV